MTDMSYMEMLSAWEMYRTDYMVGSGPGWAECVRCGYTTIDDGMNDIEAMGQSVSWEERQIHALGLCRLDQEVQLQLRKMEMAKARRLYEKSWMVSLLTEMIQRLLGIETEPF